MIIGWGAALELRGARHLHLPPFQPLIPSKVPFEIIVRKVHTLQGYLPQCAKVPQAKLKPWTANVGKQVGHHLGLAPFKVDMGLLKKSPRGSIELGFTKYSLRPITAHVIENAARCIAHASVWDTQATVPESTAFETEMKRTTQRLKNLAQPPRLPVGGDHSMCMGRGFQWYNHIVASSPGLDVRRMTVTSFSKLFPDQSGPRITPFTERKRRSHVEC
jgi:hypothetical protein